MSVEHAAAYVEGFNRGMLALGTQSNRWAVAVRVFVAYDDDLRPGESISARASRFPLPGTPLG
jgi:hypothetical protein